MATKNYGVVVKIMVMAIFARETFGCKNYL